MKASITFFSQMNHLSPISGNTANVELPQHIQISRALASHSKELEQLEQVDSCVLQMPLRFQHDYRHFASPSGIIWA